MVKLMTAYRFASLHNLPVRHHWEWKDHPVFNCLYSYNLADALAPACFVYNTAHNTSVISLGKWKSQTLKELSIWHEIGHFLDCRQLGAGKYNNSATPRLFKEARASAKAIKLMKKYNRWKEYKRQILLDYYITYSCDPYYSDETDYIHLIKEA